LKLPFGGELILKKIYCLAMVLCLLIFIVGCESGSGKDRPATVGDTGELAKGSVQENEPQEISESQKDEDLSLVMDEERKNISNYNIKLTSSGKEYGPYMSSRPGIHMRLVVLDENDNQIYENFSFRITVSEGAVLTWGDANAGSSTEKFKIVSYGNDFMVSERKFVEAYWSSLDINNQFISEDIDEIQVDFRIYDSEGQVLDIKRGTIRRDDALFILDDKLESVESMEEGDGTPIVEEPIAYYEYFRDGKKSDVLKEIEALIGIPAQAYEIYADNLRNGNSENHSKEAYNFDYKVMGYRKFTSEEYYHYSRYLYGLDQFDFYKKFTANVSLEMQNRFTLDFRQILKRDKVIFLDSKVAVRKGQGIEGDLWDATLMRIVKRVGDTYTIAICTSHSYVGAVGDIGVFQCVKEDGRYKIIGDMAVVETEDGDDFDINDLHEAMNLYEKNNLNKIEKGSDSEDELEYYCFFAEPNYELTIKNLEADENYPAGNLQDGESQTAYVLKAFDKNMPGQMIFRFEEQKSLEGVLISNGYMKASEGKDLYNSNSRFGRINIYVDGDRIVENFDFSSTEVVKEDDTIIEFGSIVEGKEIIIELVDVVDGKDYDDICVDEVHFIELIVKEERIFYEQLREALFERYGEGE